MNRTASIRIKGINVAELKENLPYISLLVLAITAILLGALSVNNALFSNFSSEIFKDFIDNRKSIDFFDKYISVAWNSLKYPIISFLCATSVLGIVLSPLCLIYVSFCYGIIAGNFYVNFGISGIVFNLFVLIIPSIVLIFTLIVSVKNSIAFSLKIARVCTKDVRCSNLYQSFRLFCLKQLVLALPIMLSVLIDLTFFDLFKNYINI